MSILQTIAQLRRPIAYGASREVFYSKRYDVIIKRQQEDGCWMLGDQNQVEYDLWKSLSDDKKKFLPILDGVMYKGRLHLIMKRCKTFADLGYSWHKFVLHNENETIDFADSHKLDRKWMLELSSFAMEYALGDLHAHNVGLDPDGRPVIIDAGLTAEHDASDREKMEYSYNPCRSCCETCDEDCYYFCS